MLIIFKSQVFEQICNDILPVPKYQGNIYMLERNTRKKNCVGKVIPNVPVGKNNINDNLNINQCQHVKHIFYAIISA